MNIVSTRIFNLFTIILILCSTSGAQAVEDKQIVTLPAVIMLLDSDACGGVQIEGVLGQCSDGATVTVTITTIDGSTRRINSVPTLSVTPTSPFWTSTGSEPVPAEITDTQSYTILFRGPVWDETSSCSIPATAPPVNGGVPLTRMVIKTTTICLSDGSTETLEVNILPML